MRRTTFVLIAVLVAVFSADSTAQHQLIPIAQMRGTPALELQLRKLDTVGNFMMTTAHPDDENNAMLAYYSHGKGYRTSLVTATHGEGGQNEIGPELFVPLAVLRTEELLAAHRFDGAEQFFNRAIDFGFSFSVEETLEKWGHDEILGDFVRLIRTIRPDVIAGLNPTGVGGGQHHQTSAILAREAFRIAGDATKYPEQIREGLRPWTPQKMYYMTNFGGPADPNAEKPAHVLSVSLSGYDALLGRTYTEIGTEARSMHKCQGMAQLLALPGPLSSSYYLVESTIPGAMQRDETGMFEGVDPSVAGLTRFAGSQPPAELTGGLAAIAAAAQAAQKAFDSDNDPAVLQP